MEEQNLTEQGTSSTLQTAETESSPDSQQGGQTESSPDSQTWDNVPFNQHPRWKELQNKMHDLEYKAKAYDDLQNIGTNFQEQMQQYQQRQQYQPTEQEQFINTIKEDIKADIYGDFGYKEFLSEVDVIAKENGLNQEQKNQIIKFCNDEGIAEPQMVFNYLFKDMLILKAQQEAIKKYEETRKADLGSSKGAGGLPPAGGRSLTQEEKVARVARILQSGA